MIHRFVKMTFRPEAINQFRLVFDASKEHIAAFPGCVGLKLIQDTSNENILYTYSQWLQTADLEAYRSSELFQNTWAQTKVLFAEKAQAWSTIVLDNVK
jgi:quinol monooxygenase YgiN